MRARSFPFLVIALLLPTASASAQSSVAPGPTPPAEVTAAVPGLAPLFHATEPLEIRIEGDVRALRRDRAEENPEREGRLILVRPDGTEEAYYVQLRTRGNFRLRSGTCDFPPIRLNLRTGELEGTLLDGQDKLKLVTHCRDRYEPNVIREYLAYRIYNQITAHSFHVRLVRTTWVDTSGREETVTRLGFLIEMEEALAERLGGEIMPDEIQAEGIHPARVSGADAVRVNLFNYMVGNTDYSLFGGGGAPPHNVVPVVTETGGILPVPYDFDFTGLVDAPYAEPAAQLPIRNVRQRLYRGLCRAGIDYPAAYAEFLARRASITAMIEGEALLEDDDREELLDYLSDFWETLSDPDRARDRIEERCREL